MLCVKSMVINDTGDGMDVVRDEMGVDSDELKVDAIVDRDVPFVD